MNPPKLPIPLMAGGRNGKACTSLIWLSGPRSEFTMALAECSLPLRFFASCRLIKIMPLFGPLPVKLKPMTEKAPIDIRHLADHRLHLAHG